MIEVEKPSVLVVDDDWINRELIQTVLSKAGYQVQTVSTGAQGLEMIAQNPPTLVILDLRLSDIDGLEVCRRIRTLPTERHIVVIIMSAMDNEATRTQAIAAGADTFLSKLFTVPALIAKLNQLIASAG